MLNLLLIGARLLNRMDGTGNVGAWCRGSNFGVNDVGGMDP